MITLIKDLFYYLFCSKNKEHYMQIAHEVNLNPFYVYRIAHGKIARTRTDLTIMNMLKDRRIVVDIRTKYGLK